MQTLRAAATGIRRADPGASVVLAGLTNRSWVALRELYDAGAAGLFDVLALHPYTARPANVLRLVRLSRRELRAHGDGAMPVWITELSWPAARGRVPSGLKFDFDDGDQAKLLGRALHMLGRRPRRAADRAGVLVHVALERAGPERVRLVRAAPRAQRAQRRDARAAEVPQGRAQARGLPQGAGQRGPLRVTRPPSRRSRGMRRALIACCLGLALAATGCGEDEREPAASPDDPVTSPADPAPPAGTAPSPGACRRLGRRIVGAELEAAAQRAERRRCTLRVAVLDGESQALTEDFQPARINVKVDDGMVTGIEFMG